MTSPGRTAARAVVSFGVALQSSLAHPGGSKQGNQDEEGTQLSGTGGLEERPAGMPGGLRGLEWQPSGSQGPVPAGGARRGDGLQPKCSGLTVVAVSLRGCEQSLGVREGHQASPRTALGSRWAALRGRLEGSRLDPPPGCSVSGGFCASCLCPEVLFPPPLRPLREP